MRGGLPVCGIGYGVEVEEPNLVFENESGNILRGISRRVSERRETRLLCNLLCKPLFACHVERERLGHRYRT